MKPLHTEFAIVRPSIPYKHLYMLLMNVNGEYNISAHINTTDGSYEILDDKSQTFDFTDYKFVMTVNGRDEYIHKDFYELYVTGMVEYAINNLTNKINLL